MRSLTLRLLTCLVLTASQTAYVCARADNEQIPAPDLVALAAPSQARIVPAKKILKQEIHLVEINSQFISGVTVYAADIGGDEAARLAKDGVFIGSNSGGHFIDLQGGNILLSPEKNLTVGTRLGNIFIGAGAHVFIVNSGSDVVVYDLLQTRPKQVQVCLLAGRHRLDLAPGRMLVLTGQNIQDFEKLEVDCHRVAYRNAQSLDLSTPQETVKAFAADFSIASAMVTIQPLRRLTISYNKQDKMLVERLVKGAVLLGDFSSTAQQAVVADPAPAAPVSVQSDSIQVASGSHQ